MKTELRKVRNCLRILDEFYIHVFHHSNSAICILNYTSNSSLLFLKFQWFVQ